ncbi:MAG: hypothetical protein OXU54_04790, partial [Gammaproteobacteria bacterium]|nr:hypothetical protein [Gammaproteobacteria bacterium]
RFALLCDAEGARERGIPAPVQARGRLFAGMTRNEAGMTEKNPGMTEKKARKDSPPGMAEKSAEDGFYAAWKAGIQRIKRTPRAPFKTGAGRPVPQCARTALYLRWIPAFAGMAGKRCVLGYVLIRVSLAVAVYGRNAVAAVAA